SVAVAYSGKGVIFSAGGVDIGRPGGESSIVVPFVALIACVIALALLAAVWLLMERTRTGNAIRAVGMDITAARLVGIDIAHTYGLTFAISASLAGAAGCLIAISHGFAPA